MYSPEAYISELKQPFNQLCHFTKVHLRPATELQLLQRPRTLANTKKTTNFANSRARIFLNN